MFLRLGRVYYVRQEKGASVSIFSFMAYVFYIFSVKYAPKTKKQIIRMILIHFYLRDSLEAKQSFRRLPTSLIR